MRFVVVYQREAHANQLMFKDVDQPVTAEERKALAEKACKELTISSTLVIDTMANAVRKAYGELPNSAYIIDRGGVIVHKEAWAKPDAWPDLLEKLVRRDR